MRRLVTIFALAVTVTALSGCIARTALDVATAPVRVAGKAVDLATTSQAEADEKRGRELRKREQRLVELERRHAREMDRCGMGHEASCKAAQATYAEIETIRPTIPAEPNA